MTSALEDNLLILYSYVEKGWNIFPIEKDGKRPVVVSRGKDQSGEDFDVRIKWNTFQYNKNSKDQIKAWYDQFPECNWAVVCGKISNLVVMDVDGQQGIESLQKFHPEIQSTKTWMQASPHGFHMFFTHPGSDVKSFPILPKVDIKGDGGYIVIHPSKIEDETYRILIEAPLTTCPGWIVRGETSKPESESDTASNPSEKTRPQWVSDLIANGSPSGTRNPDAARLVGYFWNKGIGKDIIETIMSPWATRCQPPFAMRELQTVIRSICSYQQMAKSHGVVDPPTMSSSGTGMKYTWHTFKVDIIISKLMDTDRFGLVGEWEIQTNGIPSLPKYLYGPIAVTMKDGQKLSALVAELEKRMFGPPWRQMVSDVARLSIGQFTRGQPWSLLREAPRAQQMGYAHRPLLLAKEPTLWFSAGGGMKSYLALALGVQMETGIDLGLGTPLVRNHVAYLDWEWDIGQHARRLDTLISPEDQERLAVNLVYRNCGGRPLRTQIDELKRLIAQEGVTYVIIDSASPACGRASDNDEIVAFFQSISQLNVGSLILAHITKTDRNSQDDVQTAFGGVQWENQARSTWHIRKSQEEGSNVADLVMTHQKINAGMMAQPIAIRFQFPYEDEPGGIVNFQIMNPSDLAPDALRDSGISFRDKIKFIVKNRSMSAEEIAEGLGMNVSPGLINTLKAMEQNVLTRVLKNSGGQQVEFWGLRFGKTAD